MFFFASTQGCSHLIPCESTSTSLHHRARFPVHFERALLDCYAKNASDIGLGLLPGWENETGSNGIWHLGEWKNVCGKVRDIAVFFWLEGKGALPRCVKATSCDSLAVLHPVCPSLARVCFWCQASHVDRNFQKTNSCKRWRNSPTRCIDIFWSWTDCKLSYESIWWGAFIM